jgi:zinc and cadmium transporter
MPVWLYTIISVVLVSMLSLVGVITLALNRKKLANILRILVGFAVGGLFGDALIHIIPEAFEEMGFNLATSMYVLSGILVFYILEMYVRWRHCHVPSSENHVHPVVTMNILGDGVHNFIDGMLIAASYIVSIPIGIATTLAVILHEIPQEIGDFGVLVNGGLPVRRALLFNFLSGVMAVLGAAAVLVIGVYSQKFTLIVLSVTGGGFIYIAGSDLIPELQTNVCETKTQPVSQFFAIIAGIAVMALLTMLE